MEISTKTRQIGKDKWLVTFGYLKDVNSPNSFQPVSAVSCSYKDFKERDSKFWNDVFEEMDVMLDGIFNRTIT